MSEIRLTGQWVAGAMSGSIVSGDRTLEFGGVSIDTRTLAAGQLYVAIRGDRFDGADFAAAATQSAVNRVSDVSGTARLHHARIGPTRRQRPA